MRIFSLLTMLLALSACRADKSILEEDEPPLEAVDEDGDGWSADEDCNDEDASISPDATEICDDIDNNCDGQIDEEVTFTLYADTDGDGFGDADSAAQVCELADGWVTTDDDCDDSNAEIHPGAAEQCDELDNDCDGEIDEEVRYTWYADADGDGFGDPDAVYDSCDPPSGYVDDDTDCNDSAPSAYPGAEEVCDEIDNNCDGTVDEGVTSTFYADSDGDGYGVPDTTTEACTTPSGYASDAGDCDDEDASVSPLGTELCDEIDNDCDGDVDEDDAADASTWFVDADGDGYGDASSTADACSVPSGYSSDDEDCDDSRSDVHPGATEICDGIDNDCDGDIDDDDSGLVGASTWYADADSDGYGDAAYSTEACEVPSGYAADGTDCDDSDSSSNPGASEVCDEADNDCDGEIDEGVESTWYLDYDGDGWGADDTAIDACEAPTSYYVNVGGDCDDMDTDYAPDATPGCDGGDYDCDGLVDSDADLDGYSDADCGGDDCDDSDASVLPEVGGGCAVGTTCLDVLDSGHSVGDGEYTVDPDGYGTGLDPFEVTCDMTTDGGGWTAIEYASDLAYQQHFTDGDGYRYLDDSFEFVLSDEQIEAIQALSTEGFQTYEGLCEHVIHYYYNDGVSYAYTFGFMFFDGSETPTASASYLPYDIEVTQDGCASNGGEGGDPLQATVFEISSVQVPVLNIQCNDCADAGFPEEFGSYLTDWPAWLR